MFGKELVRLAEEDSRICAVTAAMEHGTGLHHFARKFPNRYYDVGIAEQHAVTFSAGLASMGELLYLQCTLPFCSVPMTS